MSFLIDGFMFLVVLWALRWVWLRYQRCTIPDSNAKSGHRFDRDLFWGRRR